MLEIRVLVVDDEPPARHGLTRMLGAHRDIVVVGESRNGSEAVRAIRAARPDLVFLDVEMPGIDGFGVLRALAPDPPPLIVFVTAFDDYAVRAFEVHAVDYLIKPFSDRRFADTLARARQQLQHAAAADAARRLSALLTAPLTERPEPSVEPRADTLIASTGRRSVVIAIAEIDWVEAQDYCVLVHIGKLSYLLRDSIRRLEPRLAAHGFIRVHRSAMVNLARVRELRRPAQREWSLVLDGGAELPVSRRLRPEIQRQLGRLGETP
ncbi:MAG TPA: LytTR family DNA-binding domain-containing protein [Kofleriaceae bacterium]|jgi:two-component system LytT family response regulator|nr:LytTR family DNA-binding domain-containing protein [Kofleriaceae bacterium]